MSEKSPSRFARFEADSQAAADKTVADNARETRALEQVPKYNDRAELELFGSRGRTYTDPESGDIIADAANPITGKIESIRSDRRYGQTEQERIDYAEQYQSRLEEILDSGLELTQAKLLLDLDELDTQKRGKLIGNAISGGLAVEQAAQRTDAMIARAAEKRRAMILESGAYTMADYEALRRGEELYPETTSGGAEKADEENEEEDEVTAKRRRMVEQGLDTGQVGDMSDEEIDRYHLVEREPVVKRLQNTNAVKNALDGAQRLQNENAEDSAYPSFKRLQNSNAEEGSTDVKRLQNENTEDDSSDVKRLQNENDPAPRTKRERMKDALLHPGAYIGARLASRNVREKESSKEKKDRKGLKIALGGAAVFAAGFGAAWLAKQGHDTSGLQESLAKAQGAIGDLQETVSDKQDIINNLKDEAIQGAEASGDASGAGGDLSSFNGEVPDGSGGETLMNNNGIDTSVWYEHQYDFAKEFPDLTYTMPDGNIGLIDQSASSDVSKMPEAAQKFWQQYK